MDIFLRINANSLLPVRTHRRHGSIISPMAGTTVSFRTRQAVTVFTRARATAASPAGDITVCPSTVQAVMWFCATNPAKFFGLLPGNPRKAN